MWTAQKRTPAYLLASDGAQEDNLNQGDDRIDSILIKDNHRPQPVLIQHILSFESGWAEEINGLSEDEDTYDWLVCVVPRLTNMPRLLRMDMTQQQCKRCWNMCDSSLSGAGEVVKRISVCEWRGMEQRCHDADSADAWRSSSGKSKLAGKRHYDGRSWAGLRFSEVLFVAVGMKRGGLTNVMQWYITCNK